MELRHDRHTVSLLSDHMVFAPKYRGKILTGDVAMITEGIICKTCKELVWGTYVGTKLFPWVCGKWMGYCE
jgi:REP element-mobilizing transposase RayT